MPLKYEPRNEGVKINRRNCKEYTGYSDDDLLKLTGIFGVVKPEEFYNSGSADISGLYPNIQLNVNYGSLTIWRTLHIKSKTIKNEYMMNQGVRQIGVGFNVLRYQISSAKAAGIENLVCDACGDYGKLDYFSGYIVWGKLGFEMDKQSKKKFDELIRIHNRDEDTLFELLETREGTLFWTENGSDWRGIFNLSPDSQSMTNFRNYTNRKFRKNT